MRPCVLATACRIASVRVLGRALCIRHIDAGSCNGCELEIHALNNPLYNLEGLGIRFVASPRHADLLLVTGPVSKHMEIALRRTYEATPEPKLVVAAGRLRLHRRHLWRELRQSRTCLERHSSRCGGAGLSAESHADSPGHSCCPRALIRKENAERRVPPRERQSGTT